MSYRADKVFSNPVNIKDYDAELWDAIKQLQKIMQARES